QTNLGIQKRQRRCNVEVLRVRIQSLQQGDSISDQGVGNQQGCLADQAIFADGFTSQTAQIDAGADDDPVFCRAELQQSPDFGDIDGDLAGGQSVGCRIDARE